MSENKQINKNKRNSFETLCLPAVAAGEGYTVCFTSSYQCLLLLLPQPRKQTAVDWLRAILCQDVAWRCQIGTHNPLLLYTVATDCTDPQSVSDLQ